MHIPRLKSALLVLVFLLLSSPSAASQWQEVSSNFAGEGLPDDQFGSTVAIQDDLVVVGAPYVDGAGTNSGLVSIFRYDPTSQLLLEIANLVPSVSATSDIFGKSVAISGDIIVVGAHQPGNGGQGRGFVFEMPEEGWNGVINESAILMASNRGSGDYFGFSVAIDGDLIAVGARGEDEVAAQAGTVYVFEKPEDGWVGALEENAKLNPSNGGASYVGHSVAVQGNVVVTGGFLASIGGVSQIGRAYVFVEPATGWSGTLTETAGLMASDGQGFDRFGISVSIFGTTVAVGAYQEEPPGVNSNHGSIYVFEEPLEGWAGILNEIGKLRISDPSNQCKFGQFVDIEGDRIIGSSLVKEAVYVFDKPTEGWSGTHLEDAKIQAEETGDNEFGLGLAVGGQYISVGAPFHDGLDVDAGKLFLFQAVDLSPVQTSPHLSQVSLQAVPNPFNPRTTVAFDLPRQGQVTLEAFDLRGHRVAILVDEFMEAGQHRRPWEPNQLPTGVYHLLLRQGNLQQVQRITLVK